MYYLLVETRESNYGYDYPEISMFDDYNSFYEAWLETPAQDVEAMYEITRIIPEDEMRAEQIRRGREKQQRREAAMEEARKHLTRQQLQDLGLV